MSNLIDLPRVRRQRYESQQDEEKLAFIDFDEFGRPRPLLPSDESHSERPSLRERVGNETADVIVRDHPSLARRLGLFPTLRVVEIDNDNRSQEDDEEGIIEEIDEQETEETQAADAIL